MKKVILAAAALAIVGLTKVKATPITHNQPVAAKASQDSDLSFYQCEEAV